MISGQRTVVILLSITFISLVYYLLTLSFQTDAVTKPSAGKPSMGSQPSKPQAESPAKAAVVVPQAATAPQGDSSTLTGHMLELDQAHSLHIRMYGDRTFLQEQYSFLPSERVFLVMDFNQLEAGEHYLSALWKSPDGQLINTSRHVISLTRKSPEHRSYFWLQLIKNGVITEIMTGGQYKGDIHGKWSAEIYLDGARLTTQQFMILN